MPVVLVDDVDDPCSQPAYVVFPRRSIRTGTIGWEWERVGVRKSTIHGYGLEACQTTVLDWDHLAHPVYIPLLGRETEFRTQLEMTVFARVLEGAMCIMNVPLTVIWLTSAIVCHRGFCCLPIFSDACGT